MAEEQQAQERTEEATPRKLDKAREEGQIARSRELTTVALVTGGALALLVLLPSAAAEIQDLASWLFRAAARPEDNLDQVFALVLSTVGSAVLPILLVTTIASVAGTLLVGGWLVSPKALAFKAERMSLLKGLKRMFSVKSLVELAKAIGKFFVIGGVAVIGFLQTIDRLGGLTLQAPDQAVFSGLQVLGVVFLLLGLSLVLIAAIDVPFQIAQHSKQMRMTKQEVRDELKDSEGKPEVKSRIRRLQHEISQRRMLQDVPEADVIITNPEHYSVALQYEDGMEAPVVLAVGIDHMALKIREIGAVHEIPTLRIPVLARALYYATEPGDQVPAGLYVAVAQVLAHVFQLERYRTGQLADPPVLGQVEVPETFRTEPA